MHSYWEHQTWLNPEATIVIGSGIVGLVAALRLRQLQPSTPVLVLEQGVLPDGASTKNAGFACFGSLSEIASDLRQHDRSAVEQLIIDRYQGLMALRNLLGDEALHYESLGGYEIFGPEEQPQFEAAKSILESMNAFLEKELRLPEVYSDRSFQIASFGFSGVDSMLYNRAEGQIDSGKMMWHLIRKAQEAGVWILNGVQVKALTSRPSGWELHTSMHTFSTRKVLVATNGFARTLLPELDVQPARAQVLVTEPIPGLKFKGSFHLDEGYYYFRNVGNRILFGGGRNLDFEGERTTSHQTTEPIMQRLEHLLHTRICPNNSIQISHRWAGTMGLGLSKRPIVSQVQPGLVCAVRMGGMGVALGTHTGIKAAELLLNS